MARAGEKVVGTVGLFDIGDGQAALRKMFVKASFRGQGLGVASALLKALLGWSAQIGVKTIFLGTTEKFRGTCPRKRS